MSALSNICKLIRRTGPLSVAQYMREALTNPKYGYYVHKDMLGEKGDFITSSEISQIFGELIAVWCLHQWQLFDSPKSLQIIELGPGTGAMASDLLRSFKCFPSVMEEVQLTMHFVEISETLSKIQLDNLKESEQYNSNVNYNEGCYQSAMHQNVPLHWYKSFDSINLNNDKFAGLTIFLAYEFFDALPIHKFVKTSNGWKEIYVDVENNVDKLKYVILPNTTIAAKTLIEINEQRTNMEVCPEANKTVEAISKYLQTNFGACLIGDYGHFGTKEDTLRSFKSHNIGDIFEDVGNADLTADVDFKQLKHAAQKYNVELCGPIPQATFLKNMGIDVRTKMLLQNCQNEKEFQQIIRSYKMLTDKDKMGERFQFLSFKTKMNKNSVNPITGFEVSNK